MNLQAVFLCTAGGNARGPARIRYDRDAPLDAWSYYDFTRGCERNRLNNKKVAVEFRQSVNVQ
jgi:hypothetical protein